MRRVSITAMVSILALALAPASALARHHHARRHRSRTHHLSVRHRRFGDLTPTTTPTTSTPSDSAGTVDSFTNGVLTIKLANGSSVSGMVTPDTELECQSAQPVTSGGEDGDRGGQSSGSNESGGGDQSGEDNGGENENGNAACTTANLTPGTVVQAAELRISSTGSAWEKVELVV